jgi:glycosyltransferase involved in cell wall biosynthesis
MIGKKYSIIIPCYIATEKDFRRCLDSIKNQTLKPYEVICIDDASPTNVPQIAKEYGLKYIRHDKNKNNGGARNTGIREAKGDYLVFVNSDDYILPETLEEIDKINCGQDLIIIGFQSFGSDIFDFTPNEENTPFISKLGWFGEPMHIVNRNFILENNLFEIENKAICDVDWSPRVENAAETYAYVPKKLYMFQTGSENSITTQLLNHTYNEVVL